MKALILLIVSGLLAAGVFIAGKQARIEQLSPLMILFWQISGGAILVWAITLSTKNFPVWDCNHIRYYIIGGFSGISLPYALAYYVMRELEVGLVGLISALTPVITYAMARLIGLESGHPIRMLGLIAGLAGVMFLVLPDITELSDDLISLLIAFVIPVSLGVSNLYRSQFWPAGTKVMPLVNGMLTTQTVCLLILNLLLGNVDMMVPQTQESSLLLSILGLMAGISYLTSFQLLKIGGPVYLSQMGYIITAATLSGGILLWNEHYEHSDLLGMVLIFSGVLLTTILQKSSPLRSSISIHTQR